MVQEGDFEAARDYAQATGQKLQDAKASPERLQELKQFIATGQMPSGSAQAGENLRKETGPFGPIFPGYTNDPEGAIAKLMQEKRGEVADAFIHPELGPIAFVYGNEAMGLHHIEVKRGMDWVNRIPEILRGGEIVRDENGLPRAYLVRRADAPASVAVIRLDWDGSAKTWLVTAYPDDFGKFAEGKNPDNSQKRTGRTVQGVSGFSDQSEQANTTSPSNTGQGQLVVFTKSGDFFNYSGPRTLELAQELGLTVTEHDGVPMVSVPRHKLFDAQDALEAAGIEATFDAAAPKAQPGAAAIEADRRPSQWPYAVAGWKMVGGGKDVPGYASEKSAGIAIKQNSEWRDLDAVVLPFSYNDGSVFGPYAKTSTRYAVVVRDAKKNQKQQDQQAPVATETAAKEKQPTDFIEAPGGGKRAAIEDFGQKLEGARKDMPPSLQEEITDEQIASQPLSKIWPANAHEAIEDDLLAAVAFAARAEIPAKPRVSYRVKAWVQQVKLLRAMVRDFGPQAWALIRGSRQLDAFAAKAQLLEQLPRSTWGRVSRVEQFPNAYRFDEAGKQVPAPSSIVSIDGKTHTFEGVGKIGPDEIAKVKELLGEAAPKKEGLTAKDFEIRYERSTGNAFINRKGDAEYRALKEFSGKDGVTQARAYLKGDVSELAAAWEAVKARDNVAKSDTRSQENRARAGQDWRKGKDATPEMFEKAFEFRGVQFGNWVAQGKGGKDRQGMLNEAYDALHDLADLLNMPTQALSLNGSLGLAFGARGSGKAAAHFEPNNLVINLTKTKGAGSLAHEWFHALDNYFARMREGGKEVAATGKTPYREGNFITYRPERLYVPKNGLMRMRPLTRAELLDKFNGVKGSLYDPDTWHLDPQHPDGVRPQVEQAFAALVQALNASPMAKRASVLDKSPDAYWSQIIERGARSFENYVISKMAQQGRMNDFLANVRSWDAWQESGKNPERYPYLKPEEEAPVVAAFDKLFDTIEHKKGEDGKVALFSAVATKPAKGMPVQRVQEIADAVFDDFGVSAVARAKAFSNPVEAGYTSIPLGVVPSGATRQGVVELFADGLENEVDALKVVFHELFHLGLSKSVEQSAYVQKMLGFLTDPMVREYANRWKQSADGQSRQGKMPQNNWQALAVEEALADLAEEMHGDRGGMGTRLQGWAQRMASRLARIAERVGLTKAAERIRAFSRTQAEQFVQETMRRAGGDGPVLLRDTRFSSKEAAHDGQESNYAASSNPARRPGTAQDKAVMQAIADGKSARDVLRVVANTSKTPFNRQVARLLLRAGVTPDIVFGHIGKTKNGSPIHGQYRGKTDAIHIAGSAEYAAERIFLHEAMHAATMRALKKPGLHSLQLKKLYEHVSKQQSLAGFYGIKNVDEFVAEVFTNPDFQRALRNINAPSGSTLKTAWDSFVRILRSILGLNNDSHNALAQALNLGVGVVREDMVLRRKGMGAGAGALNMATELDTAEAQRQFAQTERAYGSRAAYDRAKAAGKTKLNYGQWVQVRTPAFKEWFGYDWEQAGKDLRRDDVGGIDRVSTEANPGGRGAVRQVWGLDSSTGEPKTW